MSGIYGYADPSGRLVGKAILDEMASAMSHRPWYETFTERDDPSGVGIGRIGIGIFNEGRRPVWNPARTALITLTGEIYNLDSLQSNPGPNDSQPEEALLDLYQEGGEGFIEKLEGSFILAIWDKGRSRLLIANDRFGTYPLFYSQHAGRLVYAPELKGVLRDGEVPRGLDLAAVAQYMRFQLFLGDRTFFESIKILPGGSVLTFETGSRRLAIRKYWTYDAVPSRPDISYPEAVAETGRLLRRAVSGLSGDQHRPGVFLSGGIDSRIILGLIERRPLATMTYGHKASRDVRYAQKIAAALGSDHHHHDLPDGSWVKENAGFHWDLTEGMHNWVHLHSISMLPEARSRMDVNLTGMAGGTVLGKAKTVDPLMYAAVDDYALINRVYHLMTVTHTWPGLTESEERMLYRPGFFEKVQGLAFDTLYEEMQGYLNYRPELRGEFFYFDQHNMRLINNMAVFGRSHVEFRYPYLDYRLFDFVYSLPVEYRSEGRLARSLLAKELPRLAKIPYDADEFLPTDRKLVRNIHALTVRARRRFNRSIFQLFPEWKTLYADYEGYLRGDLREWAEGILYDRRTLERGIFEPGFLRSLMARHCSGMEEWTIGKIAPLISFEMTMRKLAGEGELEAGQASEGEALPAG
jgi:asparagine synthase (glutamine-hydrolysing)